MKKTTLKNSIILMFFVFLSTKMIGQIIYDSSSGNGGVGQYILAKNIGGEVGNDVEIICDGTTLTVFGAGFTQVLGYYDGSTNIANAFADDILINSSQSTYFSTSLIMMNTGNTIGDWHNVVDRYIAFRTPIGGQYHYGWVRFSSSEIGGPSITWGYNGYAYNSVAGASINTGQTTLSLENNVFNDVTIYSSNAFLHILNLEEDSEFSLYSILGQEIKKGRATKNSYRLDTSNLSKGMYVLKVIGMESGKRLTRKIIL